MFVATLGRSLTRREPQKFGEGEKWIWSYRKRLKFLKTAKTLFANPRSKKG